MKLKLIILLIIASSLSFGQDSLQQDSVAKSSKSHVIKAKKNRKKNKQFKKENIENANVKEKISNANNIDENIDTKKTTSNTLILVILVVVAILVFKSLKSEVNRRRSPDYDRDESFISDELMRAFKSRRDYYRDVYLKSDAWRRKRYVVFKRDNWRCVHCGAPATQVHHKRYAPKNIGKEPIEWLESVCKSCHDSLHH
jgi:formate-dependent nitrite reductase cytochrome c552 subunit